MMHMRSTLTMLAVLLAGSVGTVQAQEANMSDAQIRQTLESQGYKNIQIKDHDKGHVDVMAADKAGHPVKLAVNPKSGLVTPDKDKD